MAGELKKVGQAWCKQSTYLPYKLSSWLLVVFRTKLIRTTVGKMYLLKSRLKNIICVSIYLVILYHDKAESSI